MHTFDGPDRLVTFTQWQATVPAGFSGGDGVAATSSTLYYPIGVAVDSAGDLFIADQDNDRIREVPCDVSTLTCTPPAGDTAKFIYTIAGTGGTTFFGNDIPATGAELYYPTGAASDSSGNIYIADRSNCVIRDSECRHGIISTFAGTGICGYSGDGGAATSAHLNSPYRVAVDSSNNVYIADTNNCLIRKVSGGTITTFAGKSPSWPAAISGDGGAATGAELYYPMASRWTASGMCTSRTNTTTWFARSAAATSPRLRATTRMDTPATAARRQARS